MALRVEPQRFQAWIRDEKGNGVALVNDARAAKLFGAAEDLLREAKYLVSEIRVRDGEGNIIPNHLYAALERAIAQAEG